jgi:glucuronyl/N-acetylglucosaminyl transferase EXT1
MRNCFNLTKCEGEFKFFLYPVSNGTSLQQSNNFKKILNALKRNRHMTTNPDKACVFIPMIDTLDRDRLSHEFLPAKDVEDALRSTPYWNSGENNIIFNLFSGTFPAYSEFMDIDTGRAILAKTSFSLDSYRHRFDVSLPLIKRDHPDLQGEPSALKRLGNLFPIKRKYLLSFKGKRYLYGVGAETRDAFHHLHNGEDVVMVTTCQHGRGWEKWKDWKCENEMVLYDKYDYHELLLNSTFCAVPRGRRLGSYRLLETLQAGCIPVSLSNDYILPFQEVLDWGKASLVIDERRVLQLPMILNEVSSDDIFKMRIQTDFLWEAYFSSVQKIVDTTLEVICDRVKPHQARDGYVWSSFPGGLAHDPVYSASLADFPFYNPTFVHSSSQQGYTVMMRAYFTRQGASPLSKLLLSMKLFKRLKKVVIEWMGDEPLKPSDLPTISVPVVVRESKKLQGVLHSIDGVPTDAVFLLDEAVEVISEEVEFAFDVWYQHQEQIVGFYPSQHYWDKLQNTWRISADVLRNYSLMHTSAAMIHKYYLHLYHHLPLPLHSLLVSHPPCEDIVLNVLVGSTVHKPPILVPKLPPSSRETKAYIQKLKNSASEKEICLSSIFSLLGNDTLKYSMLRMNPALYKTSAGLWRKEYPKLEKAP